MAGGALAAPVTAIRTISRTLRVISFYIFKQLQSSPCLGDRCVGSPCARKASERTKLARTGFEGFATGVIVVRRTLICEPVGVVRLTPTQKGPGIAPRPFGRRGHVPQVRVPDLHRPGCRGHVPKAVHVPSGLALVI